MEFLDNGETCNTSLVSKRTVSIVLTTHKPHHTHTTFRKLLLSSSSEHLRNKAVAFETSYVYSVVCVFLRL